jgi:hypothetical protein
MNELGHAGSFPPLPHNLYERYVTYEMILTIIGLNAIILWVAFFLCTLSILNPNPNPQIGFPDRDLYYFCSVAPYRYWNSYSDYAILTSCVSSNPLFTESTVSVHYIV